MASTSMTTPRRAGVLLSRPPAPPPEDFFSSGGWAAAPPFSSLSFFFSLAMGLYRSDKAQSALRGMLVYRQRGLCNSSPKRRCAEAHPTSEFRDLIGDGPSDDAGVFDGAAHDFGEGFLDHHFFA